MRKILICILTGLVTAGYAQITPFSSGQSAEVGARAQALGGAFTAVADDHSALYYNPAGLGQIKKTQLYVSLTQMNWSDEATYYGENSTEEANFTRLEAIGITIPVSTYRGSLAFSFGYHKIRNFDAALSVNGVYYMDVPFDPQLTVEVPIEDSYEESIEGHLSQTSFGFSVEVAEHAFIGGAVNFWGGYKDYTWTYGETGGIFDVYDDVTNDYLGEVMVSDLIDRSHFRESYSGVNLTLSTLYQANEFFQIGATLISPVTLKGKRDWDILYNEYMYPGYEEYQLPDSTDEGFFESKVSAPWRFRIGAAVNAGPVMLTGEVDLVDYSQIKYKTDPPEGYYLDRVEVNNDIRRNFKSTVNPKVGAEITIPGIGAKVRGGYAIYQSHLKDSESAWDRKVWSVGAGVPIANQLELDATYMSTSWEGVPDDIIQAEKIDVSKVLFTFMYNM